MPYHSGEECACPSVPISKLQWLSGAARQCAIQRANTKVRNEIHIRFTFLHSTLCSKLLVLHWFSGWTRQKQHCKLACALQSKKWKALHLSRTLLKRDCRSFHGTWNGITWHKQLCLLMEPGVHVHICGPEQGSWKDAPGLQNLHSYEDVHLLRGMCASMSAMHVFFQCAYLKFFGYLCSSSVSTMTPSQLHTNERVNQHVHSEDSWLGLLAGLLQALLEEQGHTFAGRCCGYTGWWLCTACATQRWPYDSFWRSQRARKSLTINHYKSINRCLHWSLFSQLDVKFPG